MISASMKDIMNKANRQEIYWDGTHAVSITDKQIISEIYLSTYKSTREKNRILK